jgi:hypothetical protein
MHDVCRSLACAFVCAFQQAMLLPIQEIPAQAAPTATNGQALLCGLPVDAGGG